MAGHRPWSEIRKRAKRRAHTRAVGDELIFTKSMRRVRITELVEPTGYTVACVETGKEMFATEEGLATPDEVGLAD